jgi:hypothetical protein
MSSHREAPGILKDPTADNTDTYAFRTPNNTVTFVTNYIPVQAPAGGPNFYEFGDDVAYDINIDNDGDGRADITYRFRFETRNTNPNTFLYNTGPITKLDDATWNRRQRYSVTKVVRKPGKDPVFVPLASGVPCPPCNIGPRSTPNYPALAAQAVKKLRTGELVFAGQRAECFYVDLGSIFDLGTLRPFQNLHLIPTDPKPGVDTLAQVNVHTIAIQVPIEDVTRDKRVPTDVMSSKSVIGVWGAARRQQGSVQDEDEPWYREGVGPWKQVSRLGNPLFNEVIVPLDRKDEWNATPPRRDDDFAKYVRQPELARLLPVLYPGVFPNLAALKADRKDLVAILLTGIPAGLIDGFQNFTGNTLADELRLNLAVPINPNPNRLGILGGDLQGYPNGRRLRDDAVTIALRAVAGATYPLIDSTYKVDGAVAVIEDGTFKNLKRTFLDQFPYVGTPYAGYDVPAA